MRTRIGSTCSTGNTFGILGAGYLKFGTVDLLTSPGFYARTALRVALFHLTPVGAALAAIGLLSWRIADSRANVVVVWLAAVAFYFLVAATGVNIGHQQYALPVLGPAAVLAGFGASRVLSLMSASWIRTTAMPTALFVVLLADAAAANVLFQQRGTNYRAASRGRMTTGRALKAVSASENLVIVADAAMDDRTPATSMTPPEMFYFSDRRGWYRSLAWLSLEEIDRLRTRGARYLAVSAYDARVFRAVYETLYRACGQRFRTVVDDDEGIIYDLEAGPS
ncbi:MAG: hypothetical protein QM736_17025 [Vicinamibacterales bacterium]